MNSKVSCWVRPEIVDDLRFHFLAQKRGAEDADGREQGMATYQRLKAELIEAERRTIIELRNRSVINHKVMRKYSAILALKN